MAEDRLESYGIYQLVRQLFDNLKRVSALDHIIGGLTNSILSIESKRNS